MNYAIYPSNKKKSTALILCIFGGYMGLHQFYVGKAGKGVLYLCTAGLCGIGWFVDIFKILSGTFHDSTGALLKDDLFLQIPRGNNTIQKFYGEQRPPLIYLQNLRPRLRKPFHRTMIPWRDMTLSFFVPSY